MGQELPRREGSWGRPACVSSARALPRAGIPCLPINSLIPPIVRSFAPRRSLEPSFGNPRRPTPRRVGHNCWTFGGVVGGMGVTLLVRWVGWTGLLETLCVLPARCCPPPARAAAPPSRVGRAPTSAEAGPDLTSPRLSQGHSPARPPCPNVYETRRARPTGGGRIALPTARGSGLRPGASERRTRRKDEVKNPWK